MLINCCASCVKYYSQPAAKISSPVLRSLMFNLRNLIDLISITKTFGLLHASLGCIRGKKTLIAGVLKVDSFCPEVFLRVFIASWFFTYSHRGLSVDFSVGTSVFSMLVNVLKSYGHLQLGQFNVFLPNKERRLNKFL